MRLQRRVWEGIGPGATMALAMSRIRLLTADAYRLGCRDKSDPNRVVARELVSQALRDLEMVLQGIRDATTIEHGQRRASDTAAGTGNTPQGVVELVRVFRSLHSGQGAVRREPHACGREPKTKKPAITFYELDAVQRIVGAQSDPARRALFALLYGTGCEVSVALRLTRADIDPKNKEIRAAGTKTYTRDRIARVADWAC